MNRTAPCILMILSISFAWTTRASAQTWKPDEGFISLYNGKDLTGWSYMATRDAKEEVFDGKTESSDGRYSAKGEILVVNPHDPARARASASWRRSKNSQRISSSRSSSGRP
jgi:hypothetical protein